MTPRKKNLLTLAAIIGIFVIFTIVGRMVDVSSLPKNNKGHLIVPHVSMNRLQLSDTGQTVQYDNDSKWSFMYIAGKACKRACKNALFYQMKRTRVSLGKDGKHIRFLVVETADTPTLTSFVKEKLPGAILLEGHTAWIKAAFKTALPDTSPFDKVYLVSPDGKIFMWYDSHADKKGTVQESSNIYQDMRTTLKGVPS